MLLVILLLASLYTAFTLFRIYVYYQSKPMSETKVTKYILTPKNKLDISQWQSYSDPNFPINIPVDPAWKISSSDALANYYNIKIADNKNNILTNIYISSEGFLAIDGFNPIPFNTKQGYSGAVYGDSIYTIKHNNLYYTFDTSNSNPDQEDIIKTIVSEAILE